MTSRCTDSAVSLPGHNPGTCRPPDTTAFPTCVTSLALHRENAEVAEASGEAAVEEVDRPQGLQQVDVEVGRDALQSSWIGGQYGPAALTGHQNDLCGYAVPGGVDDFPADHPATAVPATG